MSVSKSIIKNTCTLNSFYPQVVGLVFLKNYQTKTDFQVSSDNVRVNDKFSFGLSIQYCPRKYIRIILYFQIFDQNILKAIKKSTRCEIIECQEAQYRMPKDIEIPNLVFASNIWFLQCLLLQMK